MSGRRDNRLPDGAAIGAVLRGAGLSSYAACSSRAALAISALTRSINSSPRRLSATVTFRRGWRSAAGGCAGAGPGSHHEAVERHGISTAIDARARHGVERGDVRLPDALARAPGQPRTRRRLRISDAVTTTVSEFDEPVSRPRQEQHAERDERQDEYAHQPDREHARGAGDGKRRHRDRREQPRYQARDAEEPERQCGAGRAQGREVELYAVGQAGEPDAVADDCVTDSP